MKSFLALFNFVVIISCSAQDKIQNFESEINAQVWKPFIEAYAENDVEKYNGIHSDDILRVTKWGIREGESYKNRNIENFAKKTDVVKKIDFRFEHRIHEKDVAYEVGYYKLEYVKENIVTGTHYGRFHVVLKKIQGVWKIHQDWDTSNINGHEVGAEDFSKLLPTAF